MSKRRFPKSVPPTARLLKIDEVATRLNISVKTVHRLLKQGKLPGFKIGREWRFNAADIDRWRLEQPMAHVSNKRGVNNE